jgi:DnaJ-class molecular chaperone
MTLQDSFRLFSRLGIDVLALSHREFARAYIELAKRYHPDVGDLRDHDLMANINAARTNVLQVYRRA